MPARSWLVALAIIAVAHLIGQWVGNSTVADGTQVLLVPAVAGTVWSAAALPRRAAATTAYAAALGFSWLGDWLPRFAGDRHFVVLVACFLLGQICFIVTFGLTSRRAPSWWAVAVYAAVFTALFLACREGAGELLPLVAVYGLLLVTAGACATTLTPLVAAGAALFVLSDSLIALGEFLPGFALPHHQVAVMATYIAAQILIAFGLLQHRSRLTRGATGPSRG